ncbi:MAG: folylpolyglutamate synthase/dihydrofolate synthase family protein [Clostridiales bacterium]|jgi:dihydrofolate synthase/folylpolyglutamate synthase|nr:bifunctional folylpolyglutamate synthase/dihydrofolate synthase [Eubacteriales bacterium]MDH7565837.1 folylpolyglutamate synthase/dihydrofolate synthase family protein [Clostridiales bacterium]
MNYSEALEYIHGTKKFGWKLGLHNIGTLLELMGNPHRKLKYVHVAGTNGKGSTVAFISSILAEAGYKVGIYTSPYLEKFTERIRINGDDIPETELARITGFVKEKVDLMVERGENHPTEFEIVTAIAFQYYFESKCDIVVLEVGLGGRFDSTNIIDTPLAAVITTINYDHMEYLGNTLSKIAFEKAGIIKKGGDVVLYPQQPEPEKVFLDACRERNCTLHQVDFSRLCLKEYGMEGQVFDLGSYKELKISLLGKHQLKNAAVAVKTVEVLREKGIGIDEAAVRKGLMNAKWPGRLEVLCKEPVFLIDGAHNLEGVKNLAQNLSLYFPGKKVIFIFGVLKDKDYKSMAEVISPLAGRFITVTPENERAMDAKDLAILLKSYCKNVDASDTIEEAIEKSIALATSDDVICAFGSLYYIGDVRKHFRLRSR